MARARHGELHHTQSHVVQYKYNGVQCLYSAGNSSSTKLNHHGRNIQVAKGTAHTRLKEIRAKDMVIGLASFDVGCPSIFFLFFLLLPNAFPSNLIA